MLMLIFFNLILMLKPNRTNSPWDRGQIGIKLGRKHVIANVMLKK